LATFGKAKFTVKNIAKFEAKKSQTLYYLGKICIEKTKTKIRKSTELIKKE
jgi:hypothetical protein